MIDSQLSSGRAASILTQLTGVRLVERRIRATLPPSQYAQHQADIVAVSWRQLQVFIGEAKWQDDDFDHVQWRQFLERADHVIGRFKSADPPRKPKRVPPEWERHLALFTRRSASAAARSAAKAPGAQVLTFAELLKDLEKLPEHPEA